MSASVSIITTVRADVLAVPNAAIKMQGEQSYVEVLSAKDGASTSSTNNLIESAETPSRLPIEIGTANDEMTEIISKFSSIKPSLIS
jgi:hypothetical protein